MDKAMILEHLALAERHIAQGRRTIAHQKQIILDLKNGGHDTTMARSLLASFKDIQKMHIADRDRLKKELADYAQAIPLRSSG
jgi:hypothetical protein